MEALTLTLSILILISLYVLHRRVVAHAYAAGRADERAAQDQRERHGLAALPDINPSYTVSHEEVIS